MARLRGKIRASSAVVVFLRALHPEIKRKLRAAVSDLLDGRTGGKPLREGLAGYHSLRVGRFRAIYRVEPSGVVEFVMFGPRSTIYRETLRALSERDETDR